MSTENQLQKLSTRDEARIQLALSRALRASPVVTGALYSVVVRPGTTAGGNIYPSWTAMYTAVTAVLQPGAPVRVLVDDTDVSPVPVPAGSYDVSNWEIHGCNNNTTFNSAVLSFDDGAHLTYTFLSLFNIEVTNTATSPIVSQSNNGVLYLDGVLLFGSAGAPFLQTNVVGMDAFAIGGEIGDGTHAAITTPPGSQFTLLSYDGTTVNANAFGGAGAAAGNAFFLDATTIIVGALAGTISFQSLASQTAYTPATPADWNPAPTQVNAALDQVSAPNRVTALAAAAAGQNPLTITTAAIAQKKNGSVTVTAGASVTGSSAGTATYQLLRDANPIGAAIGVPTIDAGVSFASVSWEDQLPDNAVHTYSLQITPSAGTLSINANGGWVTARESY